MRRKTGTTVRGGGRGGGWRRWGGGGGGVERIVDEGREGVCVCV